MQKQGRWKYYLGISLASGLGAAMVGFSAFDYALPLPRCLIQAFLGFPSPSCGLTRSIRALALGNIGLSLWYHLYGIGTLYAAIRRNAQSEVLDAFSEAKNNGWFPCIVFRLLRNSIGSLLRSGSPFVAR